MKNRILAVIIFGIIMISLVSSLQSNEISLGTKINPSLIQKLQNQDKVKVEIYLRDLQTGKVASSEELSSLKSEINKENIISAQRDAIIAKLSKSEVNSLAKRKEVKYITEMIELSINLNDAVEIIEADKVWEKQINGENLTGEAQTIVVIDTGVDFTHPDLADKNILGANLDCHSSYQCFEDETISPTASHGTHVAGIVAAQGEINGVGKGANIISAKVFENGEPGTDSTRIMRAINWAIAHAEEYNITAITISLGSDERPYEAPCDFVNSFMVNVINLAFENNIPITISSGNMGWSTGIAYPSCISKAIPVGATTKQDYKATYSNYHSPSLKLFAPGSRILSTCFNDGYCRKSGTSMSTPMVAGSISIIQQLLQETDRTLNPEEIETLLFETGDPIHNLPEENFTRINLNNAILALDNIGPKVELLKPENNTIPIFRRLLNQLISSLNPNSQPTGNYSTKFTCSVEDWNNISNVTIKIKENQNVVYQETKEIANTNEQIAGFRVLRNIFTAESPISIDNTPNNYHYSWNCQSSDILGNTGQASEDFNFHLK